MNKIVCFILLTIVALAFVVQSAYSWLDCPYGRVNDPYPGQCEFYVDTNQNQICDRSETPEASSPEGIEGKEGGAAFLGFGLWSIFLIIASYFIHWYLVTKTNLQEKFQWLNQRTFRYFWNLVLLLGFIPVAFTGILWLLGIRNATLSLWHIRTGIIFTVVVVLHLWERFKYFTQKP